MAIFPVKKKLSSLSSPNISPLSIDLSVEEKIKSLLDSPLDKSKGISKGVFKGNKKGILSKGNILSNSNNIKLSIRISSVVTSISLKKSTVAIYLSLFLPEKETLSLFEKLSQIPQKSQLEVETALNGENKREVQKIKKLQIKINSLLYSFIHSHLDEWKEQDGKGLSEFITEKMILKILEFLPEKEREKFILFSSLLKLF